MKIISKNKEEETLSNNKLIATFMGKSDEHRFLFDQLNTKALYHVSYDWLMPVVEKISNTRITESQWIGFEIVANGYVRISGTGEKIMYNCSVEGSTLTATYKAAVDFIKLYNERTKIK